mmetsp:Transcript_13477/g.20082  ORF Transcript_13477/g.20082 Transcript_13477/m.20082 type:complete len:2221 (-) Transcript_13477:217-6879(-)
MILSKKGPLRPVSNSSLYPEEEEDIDDDKDSFCERNMLILNWRALLRMLLRTAPYLNEHKVGTAPSDSTYRQNSVLKRTVNLIRHSRRFFDQGLRPPSCSKDSEGKTPSSIDDRTARAIWDAVKSDLLYHTHSNSCFRAVIILYLFQPSRCTSKFYLEVMPFWMESWNSVDRCPEFDFLWLVMFCRARKYVEPGSYDWGPLRRRLLTQCGYWLQIPVGGVSADKSFPRASLPRSRGFPARLKSFVGSGSSYQEGIDFVSKVSKLVVFTVGKDDNSSMVSSELGSAAGGEGSMSSGAKDILRFLSFVAPYFNPSNSGPWTFPLGALLHYLSYELCHRIGTTAGVRVLEQSHPKLAKNLQLAEPYLACMEIPSREIVGILDALLPLCQQALYSKNGHVSRAGESALLYLTQIDPAHIAPPFLDFATRALDVSSVNLSHQAPAALSALTRLIQPSLRRRPSVLLQRLPEILRLSLAGIDSNDQNKTIRTLILYRNIASWIPIGIGPKRASVSGSQLNNSGTIRLGNNITESIRGLSSTMEYQQLLQSLPESSLLYQAGFSLSLSSEDEEEQLRLDMLVEETALSMSDWSLAFLDRIYSILRAAGEQEKVAKSSGGVASRHSSHDVQQSKNFSRVMKECLTQVFSSMDDKTHEMALRSVIQFLKDETLPLAVKDASALCQAIACSRLQHSDATNDEDISYISPGLNSLVPVLTKDLEHHSSKTVIYRLRCLAGAVKSAGKSILKHKEAIKSAIKYALSAHNDKHVFKTGCKLLRHTISSQCGVYPVDSDASPRFRDPENADQYSLGRSAQLHKDSILWHIPSGEQIDFAVELIRIFTFEGLRKLGGISNDDFEEIGFDQAEGSIRDTAKANHSVDIPQWRRSLRVLRYSLRGCVGILLDAKDNNLARNHGPQTSEVDDSLSTSQEHLPFASSIFSEDDKDDWDPNERAVENLIRSASKETQNTLRSMRVRLCTVVASMMSLISSESDDNLLNADSELTDVELQQYSEEGKKTAEMKKKESLDRQTPTNSVSSDAKICKELTEISLILLTRRGVSFRCQDAKSIWSAQKQILTDYVLTAESGYLASALQRAGAYSDNDNAFYKDGENGGKTLPRRLLVARIDLFHQSLQRHASFEVPRMLRRRRGRAQQQCNRKKMFTMETSIHDFGTVLKNSFGVSLPMETMIDSSSLDAYEGIIDGLFSMSCHTNARVRSSALGVVDYALTRFGWVVRERVPRLLSAISLQDEDKKGDSGIPSCAQLSRQVDAQGKRKRFAEVLKGVCSILAIPRIIKELMSSERNRLSLTQSLCGTQVLISLLPDEDMQKMVHYFQGIFSQFRSKFYSLPRITTEEQRVHESCILFLLDKLLADDVEKKPGLLTNAQPITSLISTMDNNTEDVKAENAPGKKASSGNVDTSLLHWRNRLLTGWFLINSVDEHYLYHEDPKIASRVWTTCFHLIENETGQPLQRVALGLFGRLVVLSLAQEGSFYLSHGMRKYCGVDQRQNSSQKDQEVSDSALQMYGEKKADVSILREQLADASFCRSLVMALVFDHKEDSSIGGGHHPQWSAGIEEILRDATSNLAPRTLFPFQRISRSSNVFKVQHSQLVQAMLLIIGKESAQASITHLLDIAKELASSPPSEDQRNQQCTSAEIFGGVCRAILQYNSDFPELISAWNDILLPFLDDVIPKIPISLTGAFFDAFRYGIHHFPPSTFHSLTNWLIEKIEKTLWQHEGQKQGADNMVTEKSSPEPSESIKKGETSLSSASGSNDGFATQSKWLLIASAILIELDAEADLGAAVQFPWYTHALHPMEAKQKKNEENQVLFPVEELNQSWNIINNRLLPCLLKALGHPYEKCREHIAGCLFRICYCHRKCVNASKALLKSQINGSLSSKEDRRSTNQDPGSIIIDKLCSIGGAREYSFEEQHHALITARKFIVYCIHLGDSKHEYSEFVIPLLPISFESVNVTMGDSSEGEVSAANRVLEAEVVKGFRYSLADVSSSCVITYGLDNDMTKVLKVVDKMSSNTSWQVRQAATHFLRCFQGGHKFLFSPEQTEIVTTTVAKLLSDERREVSSAAMAALTGILAATPPYSVNELVKTYVTIANKSKIKRKKKKDPTKVAKSPPAGNIISQKERERARQQQTSVFFLCAAILANPYDTPSYVPEALAAISKHSFEKSAPLAVRETVKMCCGEFKRTHMSDNWEVHRKQFSQEQLEALEDVVSTPHYYA